MTVTPEPDVSGVTFAVSLTPRLRWEADLRGRAHKVDRLVVTLQPDGRLSVRGFGRPTAGGPASTTAFAAPDSAELRAFVEAAAAVAGSRLTAHRGVR